MKRLVFCSILMIMVSMKSYSQTDTTKGISFERNLSWQGVLQKAKKENKYIFVDCYASWCGPCKWMDKKVYPVDSIGSFMNDRFIAVKIQMDTTELDDEETRGWYETAHQIEQQYQIGAYPTYLFFASDGRAVHKDLGFKGSNAFLSMVRAAMDSRQQYYTLLANYQHGAKTYRLMPMLADAAARMGQDSISIRIAWDYVHNYLETIPDDRLWTTENIQFLNNYSDVVNYMDKIFQFYYQNRSTIDSVLRNPQFADYLINLIVYRDLIKSAISKALIVKSEPNWNRLRRHLAKNYDEKYVHNNILNGRIEYYRATKKWNNYVKCFIQQQEEDGIETWTKSSLHQALLNNDAYEIFQHSDRRQDLEIALLWINRSLEMVERPIPDAMDTKANILYKLGQKAEGLALEGQSHALSPKNEEITANYEKMKNGLPTWAKE